jgi:hypothetical protein
MKAACIETRSRHPLNNLLYHNQLFLRPANTRAFEVLLKEVGDKHACKLPSSCWRSRMMAAVTLSYQN